MSGLIAPDAGSLALLLVIVLVAAVVRGAIGFGFSALVVAAGSLFLSPALLVPTLVLLEFVASLQMLRRALPAVQWRAHNTLGVMVMLVSPIGVYALSVLPDDTVRLGVSMVVLAMGVLLLAGVRVSGPLRTMHLLVVGAVAGLCNGLAGVGGLSIATYLTSSSLSLAQMRATLAMLFFSSELVFMASGWFNGLFSTAVLMSAVLLLVPSVLGIWIGGHIFERVDEQLLRRVVVWLIAGLGGLGLLRALVALSA